jgi:arylsulfatase A-like enzyme
MQLRPSDDELYKSAYRELQQELRPPKTWKDWNCEPKLPRHVWNGLYISSYDWVKTAPALRERQVRTCQTLTGVDRFVGWLRELLERLNLHRNTIIVFSTDHGLHFGEHGIGGKVFMYEEDLRIPLVVYDPRSPASAAGRVRDEFALVPDLAPTVLELCGLPPSPGMQGRSLAPLLSGGKPEWREDFFAENLFDHQNYPRCECVRAREWKYIRYFRRTEDPAQSGRLIRSTLDRYAEKRLASLRGEPALYEELYHLAEDPGEERNLAQDRSAAGMLDALRRRIQVLGAEALAETEQPAVVDAEKSNSTPRG